MSTTTTTKDGTLMRVGTSTSKHYQMVFDSFSDFVTFTEQNVNDRLSRHMSDRKSFFGVTSISEAVSLARAGLPRDGIDALAIAEQNVTDMQRELISAQFQPCHDVSGGEVDVARYLEGEPECMVNYWLDDTPRHEPIVTLVIGMAVTGAVQSETIAERGRMMVALVDAVQSTGKQVELWVDMTSRGVYAHSRGTTARFSIRIKAPGEPLDAGMVMYALTHPSFFRAFGFNTRHQLPDKFQRALDVGEGYGKTVTEPLHIETDYPESAIYLPSIKHGSDPKESVNATLRQLGLLGD